MSGGNVDLWRLLKAAVIIAFAIVIGWIVDASIAGREDYAGIYQFVCFSYARCLRQFAYVHARHGLGATLGISVSVMFTYLAVQFQVRRRSMRIGGRPGGECDVCVNIPKLPFGLHSQDYPLLPLKPKQEFEAEIDKMAASKVKSAALLLAAGVKYSPCDFIEACALLKKRFGQRFAQLCVASVDRQHGHIMATADVETGYVLALQEGHYYAIKVFLDLLEKGVNLTAALKARHFVVEQIEIEGSFGDVLAALMNSAATDAAARGEPGRTSR